MLAVGVLMISGGLDRISAGLASLGTDSAYESAAAEGNGSEAAEDAADPAPGSELRFPDQYGGEHSLSDYKGKIIFLNFWATWCPPCRAEMPYIQEVYEEYAEKEDSDVVFIGVAFPDQGSEGSAEYIGKFLENGGYTYPVLMDGEAQLAELYGITAFPTTFMINEKGEVYGYITGGLDKTMIELIIDQTRNAGKSSEE